MILYLFLIYYYCYSNNIILVYDFSEKDIENLQDYLTLWDKVIMSKSECPISLLIGYKDAFNKWCTSKGLNNNSQNL